MILPYQNIFPDIRENVFICDGAKIIGDVVLENDVNVWFNTVIRGDVNYIRVGARTNVQDNTMLHVTFKKYPLEIGEDVTIGHNAVVHGCKVHDRILIGMGAILLDRCKINSDSLIAAGTLIKEGFEVPSGVLVAGVPGKIIRELTEEEIGKIKQSADNYLYYVSEYRKGGYAGIVNNDK